MINKKIISRSTLGPAQELPDANGDIPSKKDKARDMLKTAYVQTALNGINSTQTSANEAVKKSSITGGTISDVINVGSMVIKGAGGTILSMLSPTTAYGGQPNQNQIFLDDFMKNEYVNIERKKNIAGMSKQEILQYDQLQELKSKPSFGKPKYLKQK